MLDQVDWKTVAADLDEVGMASTGTVLRPAQCRALAKLYEDDGRFRSTVDMAHHRFGEGEYRYFDHPLPKSWLSCGLPSGRISCRSPGTGRNGSAGTMCGPTPSRSGWSSATAPGRGVPLPCCCAMARADGTHYIVTSTATSSSLCRSCSASTNRVPTTAAASSCRRKSHAGPIAGYDGAYRAGRGTHLHHSRSPGAIGAGMVGRFAAARRQRAAFRQAHHARPHLPRRACELPARRKGALAVLAISAGQALCRRPSAMNDA